VKNEKGADCARLGSKEMECTADRTKRQGDWQGAAFLSAGKFFPASEQGGILFSAMQAWRVAVSRHEGKRYAGIPYCGIEAYRFAVCRHGVLRHRGIAFSAMPRCRNSALAFGPATKRLLLQQNADRQV
jgi:hypothetical protein